MVPYIADAIVVQITLTGYSGGFANFVTMYMYIPYVTAESGRRSFILCFAGTVIFFYQESHTQMSNPLHIYSHILLGARCSIGLLYSIVILQVWVYKQTNMAGQCQMFW